MTTKIKKSYQGVQLSPNQATAVRTAVIESMKTAYTSKKISPDDKFYAAAGRIADSIIHEAQMALIENKVFTNVVEKSRPAKKLVKKVTKK